MVILGAFGLSILGSLSAALAPEPPPPMTDAALRGLTVYEIVIMVVLGIFLALRGWRSSHVGLTPSLKDTGIGLLLAAVSYAVFIGAWTLVSLFLPAKMDVEIAANLSATTVITLSVVNAVFEEVFVCGYLINALKKNRSVIFAINVSVAIRLAYHLYQGPFVVVDLVPLGLIFGYWFAGTGRLWPLVVAHAVWDIVALWPYVA